MDDLPSNPKTATTLQKECQTSNTVLMPIRKFLLAPRLFKAYYSGLVNVPVTAKTKDSLFKELLNKKVRIKFSDESRIRSIAGTVKDVNIFYILLERELGDPFFINRSIIEGFVSVNGFINVKGGSDR